MLIDAEDVHFACLVAGGAVEGMPIAEGGLEAPEVVEMLRALAATVRAQFRPAAWVIVEEGEVVGLCSLLEAPGEEGVAKIGYGVAASRRNRGVAARAIGDVVQWARSDPHVTTVAAETSGLNIASQRVLESNAFVRVGKRTDAEDGDLICWRVSVETVSKSAV